MSGAGRGRHSDARRNVAEDKKEAATMPVAGFVVVMSGRDKGQEFRVREGKNLVGSAPEAQIRLTDAYISTRHASINLKRGADGRPSYVLVDLDSQNGTFHNDGKERVTMVDLVDNDTISFGTTKCKFKAM